MWLLILLKATKKQGFTLSLKKTFFGKTASHKERKRTAGGKIDLLTFLGLRFTTRNRLSYFEVI